MGSIWVLPRITTRPRPVLQRFAHAAEAVRPLPRSGSQRMWISSIRSSISVSGAASRRRQVSDGIRKVVRRDTGRHADGDAGRAVDEQCWETGRRYKRLMFAHRSLVSGRISTVSSSMSASISWEIFAHADFDVAHGCGGKHVHRSEVALSVYQHITHSEILRHTDDGVVYGGIAVGVVLPMTSPTMRADFL